MKIIRFYPNYIDPILKGEKTHTIRPARNRIPAAGEIVRFYSGGKAFAIAQITYTKKMNVEMADRVKELMAIYGKHVRKYVEINFRVIENLLKKNPVGL